ncbi:hypothetical protein IQ35_03110 [Sphingobium wenxiniae]|uniref:Uncharacterized protein n=2 Tax=Sphingobium wenxiniae (strain DSM 21828 / CGMCC 1.7748 / JZ-1) TaxID=595605 RepID=A0A562K868_SPHWJ|nr:hypothetical protein IQ35_03110 [Sphingobium wenxiniae]
MSQAERLNDQRMAGGAKMIAALDASIEAKYGHATPEAARMKEAAREAVAKSLERGQVISPPQVRSATHERDAAAEAHRRGEQSMREDGRER